MTFQCTNTFSSLGVPYLCKQLLKVGTLMVLSSLPEMIYCCQAMMVRIADPCPTKRYAFFITFPSNVTGCILNNRNSCSVISEFILLEFQKYRVLLFVQENKQFYHFFLLSSAILLISDKVEKNIISNMSSPIE